MACAALNFHFALYFHLLQLRSDEYARNGSFSAANAAAAAAGSAASENDKAFGRHPASNLRADSYTGEVDVSDGRTPHGTGTFTFGENTKYTGQFVRGVRHGTGVLTCGGGTRYTGEWRDGLPHGAGVAATAHGRHKYEGTFAYGEPSGRGLWVIVDHLTYNGDWLAGKFDGSGVLIARNGTSYSGGFRRGLKSGIGSMQFPNGDRYTGEWYDNVRHGFGEWTALDSTSSYTGGWYCNARHGFGVSHSPYFSYTGQFVAGRMDGRGVGVWHPQTTAAATSTATNSDTSFNGGKVLAVEHVIAPPATAATPTRPRVAAEERYEGEWRKGERFGFGRMLYASGDVYVGLWERDVRHGIGTLTTAAGVSVTHRWWYGVKAT